MSEQILSCTDMFFNPLFHALGLYTESDNTPARNRVWPRETRVYNNYLKAGNEHNINLA